MEGGHPVVAALLCSLSQIPTKHTGSIILYHEQDKQNEFTCKPYPQNAQTRGLPFQRLC